MLGNPGPGAAWRTLLLPGWGQYYKNEKKKSYIIFSAFTLNSAALITALIKEKSSRNNYLNENNPAKVSSKYKTNAKT